MTTSFTVTPLFDYSLSGARFYTGSCESPTSDAADTAVDGHSRLLVILPCA